MKFRKSKLYETRPAVRWSNLPSEGKQDDPFLPPFLHQPTFTLSPIFLHQS